MIHITARHKTKLTKGLNKKTGGEMIRIKILIFIILIAVSVNSSDTSDISFIQIVMKDKILMLKTRFKGEEQSYGFVINEKKTITNFNITQFPQNDSLVVFGDINEKNFSRVMVKGSNNNNF